MTRAERRQLERRDRGPRKPHFKPISRPPIWRSPIAAVSGLALIVGVGLILVLGQNRGPDPSGLVVPSTSYNAELVAGDALGRPDAPVTLEIWSDFQCPFCGQLARTYLPRLVPEFVVGGQLRLVAHDVNFVGQGDVNESVEAAVAASCAADQGKYWQFHDILFWNQAGENAGAFSGTRLEAMADEVGLDRGPWDACRADPGRRAAVADTTSAALAAGINSTPTLVLNGVAAAGMPRTYEDLASAIRAQLPATATPSGSSSVATPTAP